MHEEANPPALAATGMKVKTEVTKINGIEKFEGIVSRSNYDSDFTDLSPAFEFDYFNQKIENE